MSRDRGLTPATEHKVAQLKKGFVDSFADRLPALENWQGEVSASRPDRTVMQSLRTEIHQLRGSAGLYGLTDLFQALDVVQRELDEVLETGCRGPLSPAGQQQLTQVLKLMRFPSRFL
ncbi:MAG: hypothetical protein AAGA23_19410 [Pseudomonadota bacterium]